MKLDSIQILADLKAEFGEGEVLLADWDFFDGIELRIIAKDCSVAHIFQPTQMEAAKPDIVNLEYKKMFAQLKQVVKDQGLT